MRLAADAQAAFLLESVEGGENIGRYSFIGIDPSQSYEGPLSGFRDFFEITDDEQDASVPPLAGGAVGFFSYDMARELERLPDAGKQVEAMHPKASVVADVYPTVIAFDHVQRRVHIISRESNEVVEKLESRLFAAGEPARPFELGLDTELELRSNFSKERFIDAVKQAKEYIAAGDIFQVVLSQRFETDYAGDPFTVYRALRTINPSPYMFFVKRGDLCVAGSSPEMLVKVQGRELQYRPIAGTRRRGRDEEHERRLEEELLADEKERAEHLMLVDLGRNDLGRVSEYGSVEVEKFMYLEKYSHVMHLVSKLKGTLRSDLNGLDALAACFPAGTVSGAPKIRAMEIIEEFEPGRRGIYAGAMGYIDRAGNLDTCIAIRTIVMQGGRAYLQAGAGIVADSDPALEHKECHNKAKALVRSIELATRMEESR